MVHFRKPSDVHWTILGPKFEGHHVPLPTETPWLLVGCWVSIGPTTPLPAHVGQIKGPKLPGFERQKNAVKMDAFQKNCQTHPKNTWKRKKPLTVESLIPSGWRPIPTFPAPSCNSHHLYLGRKCHKGRDSNKPSPQIRRIGFPTTLSEGFVGRIHHDLGWESMNHCRLEMYPKRFWNHWPIKFGTIHYLLEIGPT